MPDIATHRIPVVGRPAQLELPGNVAGKAARCGGSRAPRAPSSPVSRRWWYHSTAFAMASISCLRRWRSLLSPPGRVLQLDAGLGGQLLDRVDEVDVLDLLHEREHIARCAAAEALVATGLFANVVKVARLVLDLSERSPYRIVEGADGVKIVFGEGEAPEPGAPGRAPDGVRRGAGARRSAVVVPAPPAPRRRRCSRRRPSRTRSRRPARRPGGVRAGHAHGAEKTFTGHPISLDFKDGDLQDIFRLFADISGLNIVVNPGVSGKVTLKLNEVPWDQALDLILKANGLGYTLEGNVIRIAPPGRPPDGGAGPPQARRGAGPGRRPGQVSQAASPTPRRRSCEATVKKVAPLRARARSRRSRAPTR